MKLQMGHATSLYLCRESGMTGWVSDTGSLAFHSFSFSFFFIFFLLLPRLLLRNPLSDFPPI